MQKALVVVAGPTGARTASLDRLDEHLRAGWRVAQASPMGGGGATDGFASLTSGTTLSWWSSSFCSIVPSGYGGLPART